MDYELYHHGVLGMKWGVRKARKTSVSSKRTAKKNDDTPRGLKKLLKKNEKVEKSRKKSVREFTDDELREKISRLELEKKYKDLSKANAPAQSKGKVFVMDVLEKSGKNIATQLATYTMGTMVNKAFKDIFDDASIVNPKKGQKDK